MVQTVEPLSDECFPSPRVTFPIHIHRSASSQCNSTPCQHKCYLRALAKQRQQTLGLI